MIWPMMSNYEFVMDPLAELHRLHRQVDQLFGPRSGRRSEVPAVNVWAKEDQAVVMASVPGLDAKDLSITVEGRILIVEGERKADSAAEGDPARQERTTGRFQRQVRLPFDVAVGQVSARYERGVVTITLPRSEESKPRKIAVSAT